MTAGHGSATIEQDDGAARRAELADFLRARRAALGPEDVGLPGGGRRRTPGLRREEVAQLASMGTTWYTWLEQGRDVRASRAVLDALSEALRLTPAEHAHLLLLGRREEVGAEAVPRETVSGTMRRLVDGLHPSPAVILGRRWDFLAWNRAYVAVFGDPGALPPHRRNHIWATFHDPARRRLFTDWEDGARSAVARFRADSARHVGDPHFDAFVADMRATSPEFADWWRAHEVTRAGEGRKLLRHPVAGTLAFEHAVFKLEATPEQRLILYTALEKHDSQSKLARLLENERTANAA